jgi:site-specific recombinase XerD
MRIYRETNRGKVAGCWTVSICDQHGKRRKFAGFADKTTTRELGRKLERLVAARVAGGGLDAKLAQWLEHVPPSLARRLASYGLIDAESAEAARPLMEARRKTQKWTHIVSFEVTGGHLADYMQHMRSRELAPQHISQVVSHCARFFNRRKLCFPRDLTTAQLEAHINHLRQTGASARTGNSALAAVKSFCRWMVREGRMTTNPAVRVSPLNERADRRLVRRSLSVNEARALIRHTAAGPFHHGCTGAERALVYRLALATGLRLNELRTLEATDFRLDGPQPTVTVQPKNEKARRGAVLPLNGNSGLARDLADHFASRPAFLLGNAEKHVFGHLPKNCAKMLRFDMERARKRQRVEQYIRLRRKGVDKAMARTRVDAAEDPDFLRSETSLGRIDFHALRHTFGSWLAQSGVHPKVCQEMMRHANIETTMQLYTHTLLDDKDKAARALPNIGDQDEEEESSLGVA